jgi:hypothetical protein
MQQGHRGRGWGALAWRWHTQEISNLQSRIRIKIGALVREERAQALDLKEAFRFSEWPTTQVGRWGSIYSPDLKKSLWEVFHQTSPVNLSGVRWKGPLEAGHWSNKSGSPDKSDEGLCYPVERLWNLVSDRTSRADWTSLVPPPDLSSGAL